MVYNESAKVGSKFNDVADIAPCMDNFRIEVFIFIALIFFLFFLETVRLLDTNYLKLHPSVYGNSILLFLFLVSKL
jgi:hypothetical protein